MIETSGIDRATLEQNVRNNIQAKYGEKPKEARQVKKSLDKDDFLRIMITEMKHQDPTKPMDTDRMANQMAQMTSVEQLKNIGQSIDRMTEKNNASDRMAMANMIGQSVTIDKGRFAHTKNTISPISFNLPADANTIKLKVLDDKGEEVFTKDLEPMKKGMNTFNWDGKAANGVQVPAGTYMVRVEAEGTNGAQLKIDSVSKEKIIGVTFEGGQALFLVGDKKSPQKVPFNNVLKIENNEAKGAVNHTGAPVVKNEEQEEKDVEVNQAFAIPEHLQKKVDADIQARMNEQEVEEVIKPEGFPNGLSQSEGG